MKRWILSILIFLSSYIKADNNYGWNIPNSSLNIGGYLDMTYDSKREDSFLFDDIAMLFLANYNNLTLLGEVELSHISLDGKSHGSSDIDINLERLELTYTFDNYHSIKIGRFNSDIGYWNQAPITILQNSTSKPHFIEYLIPQATTGILYKYNININNSLSFTFQNNQDIAHQDYLIEINRHVAMAYYGKESDLSWCFSTGIYKDNDDIEANYLGVGLSLDGNIVDIQAELFKQNSDKENSKPYSGYIQSTLHIGYNQDAVIRLEAYKDDALDVEEQIYIIGYLYRPSSNIALKAEYIYHTDLPLNRFVYSLSLLF